MRVLVNENCIGCAACVREAEKVYIMNDAGLAEVLVDPIPDELKEEAIKGIKSCPVDAFDVHE